MLVKEIERVGIPAVQICTILPIAQTVGANRIVRAIAIQLRRRTQPSLLEEEKALRESIVSKAIRALETEVNGQLTIE